MANFTLSGYLAAAISVAFSGTQQLTSLADNEYTDLSDEIDNGTNKYAFCDVYLELGSITPTGSDAGVELYLIPSVDGTNYGTWTGNTTTDSQENEIYKIGFVPLKAAAGAQKVTLRDVSLPNGKYKFAVRNRANVAFAASANTLYFRPHTLAV